MKKIMAIVGSLRVRSANHSVVAYISELAKGRLNIELYDGIRNLPQFNPDLDTEAPPREVAEFREKIRSLDGILISTPEYVFGVPGALKNAIDWTVSTTDLLGKPGALITASLSGEKAHESLLKTLQTVGVSIDKNTALLISHIKPKIDANGNITDPETITQIARLVDSFIDALEK
jgi:NAD(P)H-dependent FMN reductase